MRVKTVIVVSVGAIALILNSHTAQAKHSYTQHDYNLYTQSPKYTLHHTWRGFKQNKFHKRHLEYKKLQDHSLKGRHNDFLKRPYNKKNLIIR